MSESVAVGPICGNSASSVGDRQNPRSIGEIRKTKIKILHLLGASVDSYADEETERLDSFHPGQFALRLRQMATSQAKKILRANRLSTCALPSCRRPFAVCVTCDRGRR
jgi:hypothetical protein